MSSPPQPSQEEKGKGKEQSPPVVGVFETYNPPPVHEEGICTCFQPNAILSRNQVHESPLHKAFATNIKMYNLKGRGKGLYVLWTLSSTRKSELLKLFFPFLKAPEAREYLQSRLSTLIKGGPNDVFVEHTNGGPYEKYMSQLCQGNDLRRGPALLIAFFGRRNANPCDCCMRRMGANCNRTTLRGIVPVMIPFFECRSLQGFQDDACANCVYHVEGHLCDFKMPKISESSYDCITNARPDLINEPPNMPPSELSLGKYTEAATEIGYEETRADAVGEITGRVPRKFKYKPTDLQSWS